MTARDRALLLLCGLSCLPAAGLARAGGPFWLLFLLSLPPLFFVRLRQAAFRSPWYRGRGGLGRRLALPYRALILGAAALALSLAARKASSFLSGDIERLTARGGAYLFMQGLALRLGRKRAAPTRPKLVAAALVCLLFSLFYVW